MRRLLPVILLILLPLQITWATIIDYCQHEQNPATRHLGHHAHEHAGADGATHDGQSAGQFGTDHHCCHLSCYIALSGERALPQLAPAYSFCTRLTDDYSSPPPEPRQRPNWPFAA
jgi:hypothetical protein